MLGSRAPVAGVKCSLTCIREEFPADSGPTLPDTSNIDITLILTLYKETVGVSPVVLNGGSRE